MSERTLCGESICEALGLDPSRVTHVRIDCEARSMPVVTVTMLVFGSIEDGIAEVVKQYHLVEAD